MLTSHPTEPARIKKPRIAITAGEPSGIGPDLCIQLAASLPADAEFTIIADKNMMAERAQLLGVQLPNITIHHIPLAEPCQAGVLNANNSAGVLASIEYAVLACAKGEFDAMVTAPVHKGIINDAGMAFTGHTELIAELTNTYDVVMMLVGGGMRVALATIHLALSQVPANITQDKLETTIRILHHDLIHRFGIAQPKIYIAGLNPHAGEGGYLGMEEIETISPVIQKLCAEGMQLTGPLPADTMFSKKNLAACDAFLAMYHDQGLSVLKFASFGEGVNVTLGLPIIRSSVDHGTALDLAGTGKADCGSLLAAVKLAIELVKNSRPM